MWYLYDKNAIYLDLTNLRNPLNAIINFIVLYLLTLTYIYIIVHCLLGYRKEPLSIRGSGICLISYS